MSIKKEVKKMTATEAQLDVNKMQRLMEEEIDKIKNILRIWEDIFIPLEAMHTKNKFKIISKLFCDGMRIADIVFKPFSKF
jgi:hypothetical protein